MSKLHESFLKLEALKLTGMHEALDQQIDNEEFLSMSFEEDSHIWLMGEYAMQRGEKTQRIIRNSCFKNSQARMEAVDYQRPRAFDRALLQGWYPVILWNGRRMYLSWDRPDPEKHSLHKP